MSWANLMQSLTPGEQHTLVEKTVKDLQGLPLETIRDRAKLTSQAVNAITMAASRSGYMVPSALSAVLVQQVVARIGGLGFLNDLLPPVRTDLSEIALNPDGTLWLMKKGGRDFEKVEIRPTLDEVWRSVEALLAPMGQGALRSDAFGGCKTAPHERWAVGCAGKDHPPWPRPGEWVPRHQCEVVRAKAGAARPAGRLAGGSSWR